ncbi:MAG: MFS transporter, partial [Candidatus Acidiferrum sp.]
HGTLSFAIFNYALHNLISAVAAYWIGHHADRTNKLILLVAGYTLSVGVSVMLAIRGDSMLWLSGVFALSGIAIAAKETLEKSAAAEFLPREIRNLGFGYLAAVNAIGDMISSVFVGQLLERNRQQLAFGLAASASALGVIWLMFLALGNRNRMAQDLAK